MIDDTCNPGISKWQRNTAWNNYGLLTVFIPIIFRKNELQEACRMIMYSGKTVITIKADRVREPE